jgi:hypothetical protein
MPFRIAASDKGEPSVGNRICLNMFTSSWVNLIGGQMPSQLAILQLGTPKTDLFLRNLKQLSIG